MAIVTSQTTLYTGRVGNYMKKDPVALDAIGAPVARFEEHLKANRRRWDKDGYQAKTLTDADGKTVRDAEGNALPARDSQGNVIYEPRYTQGHSLVFSYGQEELDPDDPRSWEIAMRNTRATVEDLAPDHMALLAGEINGRSGCLHVHVLIDATNARTGKALDTNRLQHARLAIRHDRVLAENGFEQRPDMRERVADAARRMDEARAAVVAEHAGKVSESRLRRKITAAENRVTLNNGPDLPHPQKQQEHGRPRPTAQQQREDRRQRELHRYELREQERAACLEIGVAPPPERFSELVLESRIRETLEDPRVQSWDDAAEIGRENGITLKRRGKDVSYGIMIAQPDGTLAEPARAHTRRGTSLGEGFRVADVEAAIERNVQLQQAAERRRDEADLAARLRTQIAEDDAAMQSRFEDDAQAALDRIRNGRAEDAPQQPAVDEPSVPGPEQPGDDGPQPDPPAPEPKPEPAAFRSGLRGVKVKGKDSEKIQARIDGMAQLEEDYHGQLPDAEYERRINAFGIGKHFLEHYGERLEPETHQQLTWRTDALAVARDQHERGKEHLERGTKAREKYERLREAGERHNPTEWMYKSDAQWLNKQIKDADRRVEKTNKLYVEIHGHVDEGRYEDADRVARTTTTPPTPGTPNVGADRGVDAPSASDRFSARVKAAQSRDDGSRGR